MKTRTLEMQCQEKQQTTRKKILPTVALFGALLGSPSESYAQSMHNVDDGIATEVAQTDLTSKKDGIKSDGLKVKGEDLPGMEPDPDTGDEDEGMPGDEGEKTTEEKSESPASFSFQSGLGYSVTGGDALWVNRLVGSGKLFKGSKGEISVTGIADLDDPLHTVGSGKLLLGKKLYKGISLDGDYTFTGTGKNIFRFGMGYGGKLGDGSYGVKIFPLNTNGSPISAKVSISTRVGKKGSLSSFIFVDFDTKGYYSETEYTHKLAQGVAAFIQARLMGTMDGKFTGADGQILMGGLTFDL